MTSEVLAWKPINYLVHDVRDITDDKDIGDVNDNIVRCIQCSPLDVQINLSGPLYENLVLFVVWMFEWMDY